MTESVDLNPLLPESGAGPDVLFRPAPDSSSFSQRRAADFFFLPVCCFAGAFSTPPAFLSCQSAALQALSHAASFSLLLVCRFAGAPARCRLLLGLVCRLASAPARRRLLLGLVCRLARAPARCWLLLGLVCRSASAPTRCRLLLGLIRCAAGSTARRCCSCLGAAVPSVNIFQCHGLFPPFWFESIFKFPVILIIRTDATAASTHKKVVYAPFCNCAYSIEMQPGRHNIDSFFHRTQRARFIFLVDTHFRRLYNKQE